MAKEDITMKLSELKLISGNEKLVFQTYFNTLEKFNNGGLVRLLFIHYFEAVKALVEETLNFSLYYEILQDLPWGCSLDNIQVSFNPEKEWDDLRITHTSPKINEKSFHIDVFGGEIKERYTEGFKHLGLKNLPTVTLFMIDPCGVTLDFECETREQMEYIFRCFPEVDGDIYNGLLDGERKVFSF